MSLCSVFFMGHQIKRSLFTRSVLTLFTFSCLIIINYIIVPGDQTFLKYGFHLMNITSCVFIVIHFSNNRNQEYFLGIIRNILKIILYFSILNFFAYFVFKSRLIDVYGGWDNGFIAKTYNYLFFFHPEKHAFYLFGIEFVRNQGWFWEPGVNQVYLNILLYLEGFVFKRTRWIIPLIIFAILTTYSTTGIVIMIIVLAFIFIKSIKRNPVLYVLVGLLMVYPLYYISFINFERKATEKESSMNKRIFDLVQPLAIASEHPISGIGLDVIAFQNYRKDFNLDDETQKKLVTQSTEKGSSN